MGRRLLRTGRRGILAALPLLAISLAVRAQTRRHLRRIGYLSAGRDAEALAKTLAPHGWALGRNLDIEMRVVDLKARERLSAAAHELVAAKVDVLLAFRHLRVQALVDASRTIPILCGGAGDPVGAGWARSLRRPGGNVTGLSWGIPEQVEAWVGLLRLARPQLRRVVTLVADEAIAAKRPLDRALQDAGIAHVVRMVATLAEAELALAEMTQPLHEALLIVTPTVPTAAVVASAVRRKLVTLAPGLRGGALFDFSLEYSDEQGRIAAILDKLLRGENPAEIPFELPDRTVFVLNRRTARAVGVELPPEILLRATEVID
jgi:putative ABC transport system substrate-binding protein